jgi:hypothetical protein
MDGVDNLAERATGARLPRPLLLDASALDLREEREILREDVKRNRIVFEFPDGLADVDILDECRALDSLDDFDAMHGLTMQKLVGKSVIIWIRQDDGTKSQLCSFHVSDREQNLRGVAAIDEFPFLLNWLVEFMAAHLAKQFPTPISAPSRRQASEKATATGSRRTSVGAAR